MYVMYVCATSLVCLCLYLGFTAQSTQGGHVERGNQPGALYTLVVRDHK